MNNEEKQNKLDVIKKMLRQKQEIRDHIRSGGDIEDLDKEEYGFKQPL